MNASATTMRKTKGRRRAPASAVTVERASAGGLAAARDADLLLQALEADRANHDLLADHVARRSVQAHFFGKLHILFDGRLDLGAREILLDPRGVEAGVLCRSHGTGLVGDPSAAEQLLVEVEIF